MTQVNRKLYDPLGEGRLGVTGGMLGGWVASHLACALGLATWGSEPGNPGHFFHCLMLN